MPAYSNASGRSGVASYDIVSPDEIHVTFTDGDTYAYTEDSVGRANLDRLMNAAQSGHGLHRIINERAIYHSYSRKL